jgi:hypothetical protein
VPGSHAAEVGHIRFGRLGYSIRLLALRSPDDVRLVDLMPGASDSLAADDQSWVEREQIENLGSGARRKSGA